MAQFGAVLLSSDDREVAKLALSRYGSAIEKNWFGVEAPINGPPRQLSDWNANGLATRIKEFRKDIQKKGIEEVVKTLGAASSSTTVFIPTVIQPGVIDIVRRRAPFYAAVQKIPAVGKTVHVPRRTAGVTPTWGAGDGASLTAADQTFTEKTANMAYLYVAGSIAWAAQKLTKKTLNLIAESTQAHYLDLIKYKEQVFFRGDAAGGSGIASAIDLSAQSSNFTGLLPALEDASKITDLAGARGINIGDVDAILQNIEDQGGEPGVIYVDRATYTRLRKEASAAQRIDPDTPRYGFGLREFNIDGIPVIWSPGLSTTSGQRTAVGIDFRAVAEFPLLPEEYVDVAQQLADKKEFFYRNYTTFLVVAPEWGYAYVDAA